MVEYLKINGKKHPIRISYYALTKFKSETGISFEELSKLHAESKDKKVDMNSFGVDEFKIYEILLYYSLISGLKHDDKKATLEFEQDDMFDLLEDCLIDFAALIPKFFKQSEAIAEIGEGDDGKKPLVGNRRQKKSQEKAQKKKKRTTPKSTV